MTTTLPNDNTKYVVLQGIKHGNRFFSTFMPGEDQTRLDDGTVAYRVMCYSDTVYDAQAFLYGKWAADTMRQKRLERGENYE